jgi:calpain-7
LYQTRILTRSQVCTEATADSEALSILASYDGPFEEVGYTVNVYASTSISWDKTVPKAPFTQKVSSQLLSGRIITCLLPVHFPQEGGILTSKNAGGNCTYPTYMVNPQYHMRICPENGRAVLEPNSGRAELKASVVLTCQASREIPLNVTLVWSQGERIVE